MKKIFLILVVSLFVSTTFAQQVRDLKNFYTDNKDYNELTLEVNYYKDTQNLFTPFLGQWKYVDGNNTFIVTLWKETQKPTMENDKILFYCDEIFGHYAMYENYGLPTQNLLYTSQTNIGTTTQTWQTVIFSDATISHNLSGMILDIYATPLNPVKYPQGLKGFLSMKINPGGTTAIWHVGNAGALFDTNEPRNFIIPTNATLTKM